MTALEAYLDDLARRLEGKLAKNVVDARLREVRAHLIEAVENEGERAALRRFGNPAANARAILRQGKGYDERSVGALSRGVGLALALAFAVPYVWMDRGDSMTELQSRLGLWLPFLAAIVFALRCLQTRRWLVVPTSLWAAAGIATIFLVSTFLPARLSPRESATRIEGARVRLAETERNARDVAAWRAGHPPLDSAPYAWKPHGMREVAGLPVAIPMDTEVVYDIQRFQDPQPFARAAWSKYGKAFASAVARERREAARWLAAAEAGYARAPEPWGFKLRLWGTASAQIATLLLAFNALALLGGGIVDRWPTPRRGPRGPVIG